MKNDAPYYMHKVECPVCKTINEFETIKVGAYEEQGRDTDFRPIGITWKNPKYQKYNPTLFFMATCSNCYFTREYTSRFRDWKSDSAFRNYRLKSLKSEHVLRLAEDESVIKMLGGKLSPEDRPLETAISKLLLGIYDELLCDKPSNLDVARYFLRAAWLFRDCQVGEPAMQNVMLSYISKIEERVDGLSSLFDRLDDARLKLKLIMDDLLQHDDVNRLIGENLKDGYGHSMAFLAGASEQLASAVSTLREIVDSSNESAGASSADGSLGSPFDSHESYIDFLKSVRKRWELIPISEHEALRFSLKFYKQSYEGGHEVNSGNQQIQVEYLLGELCRRLGRNDEAKQYFKHAVRSAQNLIFECKGDRARSALARKILEMALTQGKQNLREAKRVESL